jgi:protein tyrosine/serine phosphatase
MHGAELNWVREVEPYRLALMPRPRGGDWLADEITGWNKAGVNTVVSLLEPHEVRDLELENEAALCEGHQIQFLSFPIPDRGTPSSVSAVVPLLTQLASQLRDGRATLIHCRVGIGRSGLMSGCLLHLLGVPFDKIFPALSQARGVAVPDTGAQVAWVQKFTQESASAL